MAGWFWFLSFILLIFLFGLKPYLLTKKWHTSTIFNNNLQFYMTKLNLLRFLAEDQKERKPHFSNLLLNEKCVLKERVCLDMWHKLRIWKLRSQKYFPFCIIQGIYYREHWLILLSQSKQGEEILNLSSPLPFLNPQSRHTLRKHLIHSIFSLIGRNLIPVNSIPMYILCLFGWTKIALRLFYNIPMNVHIW